MTWVIFLLLFFSFVIFLLSPVSPLGVGLIFLALQLLITLTGYFAWRRRRRHNRSSFMLAFFTMVHFFMLITMTGVLFLITIPQEKDGDSVAFLRGVGNIVAARTGIQFGAPLPLPKEKLSDGQSLPKGITLEIEDDEPSLSDKKEGDIAEPSPDKETNE